MTDETETNEAADAGLGEDAQLSAEIIDGTYCKDCYIIFGRTDNFKIGIRPLLDAEYDCAYIGFRIRAVPADADIVAAEDIDDAFPGFEFGKRSSKRCSLVGGMYVNINYQKPEQLQGFISNNRIVGKTISALKEWLGDIPMVDEDDVYSYLQSSYTDLIEAQCSAPEDQPEEPTEVMGTVIHMQSYKAKKAFDAGVEEHGDIANASTEESEADEEVSQ